ncbi:FAD-dependent oxidoreductase [Crocinitomix catalasitica]|uniref:FAD-dependent oxidoreductase n=1 Tax=Crocinitomix catalasitica TaxID=184607 RepID=UPI0004815AFF|nr:FAD-dependent oxidoreductase [Crocinitomix catalasitica]
MKEKTIVIGAGPAGISCAYELRKKGVDVEVFEASKNIGGMARSFDLWGQRVDIGPHRFFSKQKEINHFFTELIQDDFTVVDRQTRIYYRNRFFDYPLKLGNVLSNLPLLVIFQILWFFGIEKIKPKKKAENFEEWITNRFGKKLFEIFFKHYTEKLWGIKCTEIDADWAAQRIKTLTLMGAVKSAIIGNRGNKHKTLVDQFAYPKNGSGTLYERAADYITNNGGKINLETPIKKIILNEKGNKVEGVVLLDGTIVEATSVVSTMPITTLIKGFENVPEKVMHAVNQLNFRNTILVYLEIDKIDLFEDNWIYIHSPEVKHGRITNFRNWCPSLNRDKKTTILCLEFWCFEEDEIWTAPEKNVVDMAKDEIYKINLVSNEVKILNTKVLKIPKCYPVYKTGYQDNMNPIIDYLNSIEGLYPIGRYGAFKYNNQDHSILMGLLAAEKIADQKPIDLWQINTDTEYQEDGEIKNVLAQ